MAELTAHTVKSFDDDIHQLRSLVTQMGGLCEAQITNAIDALMERDPEHGDGGRSTPTSGSTGSKPRPSGSR